MVEINKILIRSVQVAALAVACTCAYRARLHAVNTYGNVIHEFDPYFNLRATEYLVDNGWNKFINWFDDRTWYPLGRPVGTTIYPGLQFTSAAIYHVLNNYFDYKISINDVCVFVPAWFSIVTSVSIFGMAYEATRSMNAAVTSAFVMSVIPAHIMRSVAGGYDNESIAMGAMCTTFFFWMRSLRGPGSWVFAFLTAASYTYMVAAWGGYVFVLNMIGLHALFLLVVGYYSSNAHLAYSLFYILGTIGAIQWPVVGLAPVKSLEQLGPMFVFFLYQMKFVMELHKKNNPDESLKSYRAFQRNFILACFGSLFVAVMVLAPNGYFGPLSSRIRGLFIAHTHTGNPLVDSVAEHQATQDSMFWGYFHCACYFAPVGLVMVLFNRNEAKLFLFCYACVALYFSRKMNRLVLILAPAASVLMGIAVSAILEWNIAQLTEIAGLTSPEDEEEAEKVEETDAKKKEKKKPASPVNHPLGPIYVAYRQNYRVFRSYYNKVLPLRVGGALVVSWFMVTTLREFWVHSDHMGEMLSNPSIMMQARTQDGRTVMLDDFRQAYWWIRDNTPEDARILSWWDYGYQISQIANRTTLADGNTWNHEHIALLGRILVSKVKDSHAIARHLADYVLVWSTRFVGNPGDDIAKAPHMARICGSVFRDVNPNEFYMDHTGRPSKMMLESLVYNLVLNKFEPGVPAPPADTFKEVYTSPNRMVRVYKIMKVSEESKAYCAENRGYQAWLMGAPLLDAYPPALKPILAKRKAFEQLEDFNKKSS